MHYPERFSTLSMPGGVPTWRLSGGAVEVYRYTRAAAHPGDEQMNRTCAAVALSLAAVAAAADPARSELDGLMELRSYQSRRVSSNDATGRNEDGGTPLLPGESRVLADLAGAGVIRHIWTTIASEEAFHLKKLVIRMYWDAEKTPSVETPIGDFFGLGLGEYVTYESAPLSVGHMRSLNSFFPMPFGRGARITVTNEGSDKVDNLYYHVDYEQHRKIGDKVPRFHAQYRQATPTAGWTSDWKSNWDPDAIWERANLDGAGNYTILEATGRGHYVGATHSILQNQGDWWGEGDDMIFIDGDKLPTIVGTGAEDYYLGAWCYGGCGFEREDTFAFQRYGNPLNGGDRRGSKWLVYRYHLESPLNFERSIRVTVESGHANHRSDNYFTTAYWYQIEPHAAFPALAPVAQRIPRVQPTGGPEEPP
jgi:hypothetical protein